MLSSDACFKLLSSDFVTLACSRRRQLFQNAHFFPTMPAVVVLQTAGNRLDLRETFNNSTGFQDGLIS